MFRGARMNCLTSMKKLGSDCRASGQWGVYLRGTQWSGVDTSMGMTPLEGLMMGTRSGDVDFGAMAWIAKETGADVERSGASGE